MLGFSRAPHRFTAGEQAKLYVCECEQWDVFIVRQTRAFGWWPSYDVIVIDGPLSNGLNGVLDCALKKGDQRESDSGLSEL